MRQDERGETDCAGEHHSPASNGSPAVPGQFTGAEDAPQD